MLQLSNCCLENFKTWRQLWKGHGHKVIFNFVLVETEMGLRSLLDQSVGSLNHGCPRLFSYYLWYKVYELIELFKLLS